MKKLLLPLFLLLSTLSFGQFYQYRILNPIGGVTATGNTGFYSTSGLTASYASLTWTTTGTLATCTVQVDYSTDGTTVVGQLIAAQTCTSSGTFTAASTSTPAYVRVSYVLGSGGGKITFADYGCNNSTCQGSGGGSVSSISQGAGMALTPNPITSTGTVALATALPNGETATTQTLGDNTTKVATDAFVIANAGTGTVTGTGTANTIPKWTSASAQGNSSLTDDGTNPVGSPNGTDIATTGGYDWQIANNGTTGTTLNKLACDDGTGKAIICSHTTSTTNDPLGVAVHGNGTAAPGTTGNTGICLLGFCTVVFDGAATALHYAQESATVDGDLSDVGATAPTNGQTYYFIVQGNAGAGTTAIIRDMTGSELNATTKNGGGVKSVAGTSPIASSGGNTPAISINNNGITATQLAVQYSKGSCTEIWGGSGTSNALTSGDDAISNNSCYNDSGVTRTITAVKCRNDNASNTTTVNPTFGSAGTGTTILSGALTCGNSYAYSASGTVSNANWTTGTGIDPVMGGTLTGTSIAMIVEYTY